MIGRDGGFNEFISTTSHVFLSLSYLYEKREVIDDAKHTVFEYARWQSYCAVLISVIGTIRAVNIVEVMIASREN